MAGIDAEKIKQDFPILKRQIYGKRLVYLDSTATTQRPKQVIESIKEFYENHNANVHRGIHKLSEEATGMYEQARRKVASFINAKEEEIIFVRNATEALNLVAYAYSEKLKKGDEITTTIMEHHSNYVPWLELRAKGIKMNVVDINSDGTLNQSHMKNKITENTKLVAVTQASNVVGTINDVKAIARDAHKKGAPILVDGAQSVPHMPVDVKELDCDFLAFSGHKMLGPTGIGVLYGKKEILEGMKPFMYGGDMITEVHETSVKFSELPYKFEAGTPNIADAIGFGAALDYLKAIGMSKVREHEKELIGYALDKFSRLDFVDVYGPKSREMRGAVLPFNVKGVHAHDVSEIVDKEGIAIRSGYHCAQPLHERLGIVASARASFYVYNNEKDADALVEVLKKVKKVFL